MSADLDFTTYPEYSKTRENSLEEFKAGFQVFRDHVKDPNYLKHRTCIFETQPIGIMLRINRNIWLTYRGKYYVIETVQGDYEKFSNLSCHFTDEVRSHGIKFPKKNANICQGTPHEYWLKEGKAMVKDMSTRNPDFNSLPLHEKYHLVRERLYTVYGKHNECTTHRPTIPAWLYKHFEAKKVLDMCAGWGDRLIAAAACECEYDGYDPNSALIPCLNYAIKVINEVDPTLNLRVFQECIETAQPDGEYDLAYTSPPYFTEEIYCKEKTQSVEKYATYNAWINGFLHGMLNTAINSVKDGGHIAINIVDFAGCKLIEPTIAYMNKRKQIYEGIIWYRGGRNYLGPILIFRTTGCRGRNSPRE